MSANVSGDLNGWEAITLCVLIMAISWVVVRLNS